MWYHLYTMIDKLKTKWGISSNWQFFIINIVFAVSGMVIVFERKPLFHWLGVSSETPFLIKAFFWLIIVFPAYQLNLLIFGSILGQFEFFWNKEKKLLRFLMMKKRNIN